MAAFTVSSEAEIVNTPANVTITRTGPYSLDLNHDGIVDFMIADHISNRPHGSAQFLLAKAEKGNQVNCLYSFCLSTFAYAAALSRGSEIGPAARPHGWLRPEAEMAAKFINTARNSTASSGPWDITGKGYLGLEFQINGEIHFGWARFTVKFRNGDAAVRTWEAHLSGYAYETVAGKSIHAGQTSEGPNEEENSDASVSSEIPAQLGALALGNSAIRLWRREE